MPKLIPQQVQINYIGLFSKPIFSLWNQGGTLEKLFTAFQQYNVSIGDMRYDVSSPNFADATLTVHLFNFSGSYKYKLDRVEAVFQDYTEEQFPIIPDVLRNGDECFRSLVSDFSFQTHLFTHASHNELSEGTSKGFLQGLSNVDVPGIGLNQGNGITFHWDIPERNWRFQLAIDHSTYVNNGVFLQFLVRLSDDRIDYVDTFQDSLALGRNALAGIGLEV